MTVGEKIRKYRLKLNISQKLLASWCKISEPALRNYELGNTGSCLMDGKIARCHIRYQMSVLVTLRSSHFRNFSLSC